MQGEKSGWGWEDFFFFFCPFLVVLHRRKIHNVGKGLKEAHCSSVLSVETSPRKKISWTSLIIYLHCAILKAKFYYSFLKTHNVKEVKQCKLTVIPIQLKALQEFSYQLFVSTKRLNWNAIKSISFMTTGLRTLIGDQELHVQQTSSICGSVVAQRPRLNNQPLC